MWKFFCFLPHLLSFSIAIWSSFCLTETGRGSPQTNPSWDLHLTSSMPLLFNFFCSDCSITPCVPWALHFQGGLSETISQGFVKYSLLQPLLLFMLYGSTRMWNSLISYTFWPSGCCDRSVFRVFSYLLLTQTHTTQNVSGSDSGWSTTTLLPSHSLLRRVRNTQKLMPLQSVGSNTGSSRIRACSSDRMACRSSCLGVQEIQRPPHHGSPCCRRLPERRQMPPNLVA